MEKYPRTRPCRMAATWTRRCTREGARHSPSTRASCATCARASCATCARACRGSCLAAPFGGCPRHSFLTVAHIVACVCIPVMRVWQSARVGARAGTRGGEHTARHHPLGRELVEHNPGNPRCGGGRAPRGRHGDGIAGTRRADQASIECRRQRRAQAQKSWPQLGRPRERRSTPGPHRCAEVPPPVLPTFFAR